MFALNSYFFFLHTADALPGVQRWQARVWAVASKFIEARKLSVVSDPKLLNRNDIAEAQKIWQNKNCIVSEVTSSLWAKMAFTLVLVTDL